MKFGLRSLLSIIFADVAMAREEFAKLKTPLKRKEPFKDSLYKNRNDKKENSNKLNKRRAKNKKAKASRKKNR